MSTKLTPVRIIFGSVAILWGLASGFQAWAMSALGATLVADSHLYLFCLLPIAAGVGLMIRKR